VTKLIDITGKRFGRWTVLELAVGGHSVKWLCRCDCGSIKEIHTQSLRNGGTKSCGCYLKDRMKEIKTTHGHSNIKNGAYNSWLSMRRRCLDTSDKLYPYYGGRGIKVCERWIESFENFLDDMGERPPKLTLERKDCNGNYEPNNCHWATRKIQSRNKRSTKLTLGDAVEIVKLRKMGLTYKAIGDQYNVGLDHAWQICKGRLWPEAKDMVDKET
jgi:hypothetical protein